MSNIFVTIFVLGFIILIHELGHFLSARLIGVAVPEFSVGMGPRLFKYQGKQTVLSLRALPLGGYCLFESDTTLTDERGRSLSILGRGPWEKIFVSVSGPLMNFILAALILILLFTGVGMPTGYEAVVGAVNENGPAAQAGLLPGDRILQVGNEPVTDWLQMTEVMQGFSPGESLDLVVERGAERLSMSVTPEYDEGEGRMLIGISLDPQHVLTTRYPLGQGIILGFQRMLSLSLMMLLSIGQLFSGAAEVTENLAGPVGLVQMISETASTGWINTIFLMAFLSINLGILNLLPVPALDGGKIVLYFIELLRGKPMDQEKEGWIHMVGYVLLMGLILVLTYQDILKLFQP